MGWVVIAHNDVPPCVGIGGDQGSPCRQIRRPEDFVGRIGADFGGDLRRTIGEQRQGHWS